MQSPYAFVIFIKHLLVEQPIGEPDLGLHLPVLLQRRGFCLLVHPVRPQNQRGESFLNVVQHLEHLFAFTFVEGRVDE